MANSRSRDIFDNNSDESEMTEDEDDTFAIKVTHAEAQEMFQSKHLQQWLDDAAEKLKSIIYYYEVLQDDPVVEKIMRVRDRIVEDTGDDSEEALEEAINSYRKKLSFIFECW